MNTSRESNVVSQPDRHAFNIFPAIDLRRGQVVRLVQGDPNRQTTYGDDPAGVALRWLDAGARWLHVVNLDGAFGESAGENQAALRAILAVLAEKGSPARVQFGGGLRTLQDIETALSLGVGRVMLGSMAVEAPQFIEQALARFGAAQIGLAMDVHAGVVRTRGWTESAAISPIELGRKLQAYGLRVCAYTDIQRDGGGTGLNLPATQRFAQESGLSVIASGGVVSLDDVRQARGLGLFGVIIGRALYEGYVDLREALSC